MPRRVPICHSCCGERAIRFVILFTLFFSLPLSVLHAQAGFFHSWQDRVRATTAKQPAWPSPLVITFAGIAQRARFDFVRQETPSHTITCNYGNSKGVDLIPFANTEVDLRFPPYIQHNNPKVNDGAGDFSMSVKYRFLASDGKQGNYAANAQLTVTWPTGSYKNGSPVSTLNPLLVGGKGFGRFVFSSSLGGVLPTSSTEKLGRSIPWNTAVQYDAGKHLWPELEVNSTFYLGGPN